MCERITSLAICEVLKVVVDELADYGPMVRCIDSELIFVKTAWYGFKEEGSPGLVLPD